MNEIATPRTNAETKSSFNPSFTGNDIVDADFARQLERELIKVKTENEKLNPDGMYHLEMVAIKMELSESKRQLSESYKALDAIDHITSGDFLQELEMRDTSKMDADLKQCMEALSLIFKIAHSESPNHTCHAVHGGWRTLKSKVLETSEP